MTAAILAADLLNGRLGTGLGRTVLAGVTAMAAGCASLHGATVALIGLNGAGKASLVKLLCRMYDPQHVWHGMPSGRPRRLRVGMVIVVRFPVAAPAPRGIWPVAPRLGWDRWIIKRVATLPGDAGGAQYSDAPVTRTGQDGYRGLAGVASEPR